MPFKSFLFAFHSNYDYDDNDSYNDELMIEDDDDGDDDDSVSDIRVFYR